MCTGISAHRNHLAFSEIEVSISNNASVYSSVTSVSYSPMFSPRRSLQMQVHKKRAKDPLQGCAKTRDQTQTSLLSGEDDICDHGERVAVQRSGVLSPPQAAEHQEPCQVVQNLEGQAQGV